MKRRTFLQLLGGACASIMLGVRRAPAGESAPVTAAPAVLNQAVLNDIMGQLNSSEALQRATDAGEAVGRDYLTYRRYPGAWVLNPNTRNWEYTFEFGANLRNMAVPRSPQRNRRHGW